MRLAWLIAVRERLLEFILTKILNLSTCSALVGIIIQIIFLNGKNNF